MRPGDGAKPMSRTNASGQEGHAARAQPRHHRFDNRLVLVEARAQDVRHDRQIRQQGQEAVHVAPHLHRTVLRQRPHDRRPEQPEFGGEEAGPEEFVDAPPVQHRLGGQREPHKIKPVADAQAEMLPSMMRQSRSMMCARS